jgi:hypothetical protein
MISPRFAPLVALLAAAPALAQQPYSAQAEYYQARVSPQTIHVFAYEAENQAELWPTKVVGHVSFIQGELREGDTATMRFSLLFDPDTTSLVPLYSAVPPATFRVDPNNPRVDQDVSSPLVMPARMNRYGAWCGPNQRGISYGFNGSLIMSVDNLLGARRTSGDVELLVHCLQTRFSFVRFDRSRLPPETLLPKIPLLLRAGH